jgi:hypothetical protein
MLKFYNMEMVINLVKDGSNIQDGTMNATGTNDANVDFDARKVGNIFIDFDRAVNTINRYRNHKKFQAKLIVLKMKKISWHKSKLFKT